MRLSKEEALKLLAPWTEGPFTLEEAQERYGPLVERALKARVLKPVPTRFGPVLAPGSQGRRALGLTRFYTPRPSSLEDLLCVRREAERLQGEGYRLVLLDRGRRPKALLEKDGLTVLVVSLVGEGRLAGRELLRGVGRVVVVAPEGHPLPLKRVKPKVEVRPVWMWARS
jgi:hypothetical protein